MRSIDVFMNVYLDRFNIIKVYVDIEYYGGIVRQFYIKDIDHDTIKEAKIAYDYLEEDKHVYELLVDNVLLGHPYQVVNNYGLVRNVEMRGIVNDPMFDHVYMYLEDDLGATYSKEYTIFRVWSPTSCGITLKYTLDGMVHFEAMERVERGVYFLQVNGNLDGVSYTYLVYDGIQYKETADPYALSSSINGLQSIVIDSSKITKTISNNQPITKQEMIIYEASIRDFTREGRFVSFTNSPSFEHIVALGISHIQLLPIHDFTTVEESNPSLLYNWGYDPHHFGIPEGSYSTNPKDPYARINECIGMINSIHQRGLYVSMDLVFNHMYDVITSSFQCLVPYYYFRNDDDMNMSNGTFCSNDINSASFMVRKYLVDMAKRWAKMYGVDAFRFDLMGILDVDTINQIEYSCRKINSNFIVYGEGWDMPTMLASDKKAASMNQAKMSRVGFFNDQFRNTIRGDYQNIGYALGNREYYEEVVNLLTYNAQWNNPMQSLNFAACHDNFTLFDYLQEYSKESLEVRLKQQKLVNAFVLLFPGIPFLHGGQEICRSKQGCENSYNAPDSINHMNWENKEIYKDQEEWVRQLIAFRKTFKSMLFISNEDVKNRIHVERIEHSILVFHIHGEKKITIIMNPTKEKPHYCLGDDQVVFLTSANSIKKEFSSVCIEPLETYILVEK